MINPAKTIRGSKVTEFIDRAFHTPYFAFVTALITLLGSIFGWEIFTYWYIGLCSAAILLLCKDISPLLCPFIFLNISVSRAHSPASWGEDKYYLLRSPVLPQLIVIVGILAACIIFRIFTGVIYRRFKPNSLFAGLCVFCAALCLNGLFSLEYYYMDLVYGLGLSAILILVFVLFSGNVHMDDNAFMNFAYYFLALFCALTVQLIEAYISCGVIHDGAIDRGRLRFGWGMYNQFGLLITMCVPVWFYFAKKFKYGYPFLLGAGANFAVALMCMSRQAILMSAVLVVACSIWYVIVCKKRERLIGGGILLAELLVAVIIAACKWDTAIGIFKSLLDSLDTGSGRTDLWEQGVKNWISKPLFGVGFYTNNSNYGQVGYYGSTVSASIPRMCHNTIFQIASSCGTFGLAAYLVHRVQTLSSLLKNLSNDRIFIAMTGCAILLTSLLDNHLFYFLPTLTYAALLAMLSATEKQLVGVKAESGLYSIAGKSLGDELTISPSDIN